MRMQVIETMVNTIEKIAKDNNVSEDEYRFTLALLMVETMQHQDRNPMYIVMDHDLTLMKGLAVEPVVAPVFEDIDAVH